MITILEKAEKSIKFKKCEEIFWQLIVDRSEFNNIDDLDGFVD